MGEEPFTSGVKEYQDNSAVRDLREDEAERERELAQGKIRKEWQGGYFQREYGIKEQLQHE